MRATQRTASTWYVLAVAAVAAATLLTMAVPLLRDRLTFFAFWPVIFVVAWVGGVGPGLLSTLLSTFAVLAFLPLRGMPGTTYGFFVTVGVFIVAGASAGFLAHWRTRTEGHLRDALEATQGALRQAEAASRAKDAFLATVSHELRTPLSPILAWARMLQTDQLDATQTRRAIDVIVRNAKAQAQLIEDLLDVSRIAAGKLRLSIRSVTLAGIVESAVETIRPAADAKGIRLVTVLDTTIAPIAGDPDRLQQVIWNLVSNAVKFTPKGGRVQVVLERVDSQLEIAVMDTGQGIAADQVSQLFERFWQADPSTSRAHGGLGLGLAIVRHLVELHGGSVSAASAGSGQGATFTVKLPVVPFERRSGEPPRRHPTAAEETGDGMGAIDLSGIRALVVDDEPDAQESLSLLLGTAGAEVRVAASVAQAMEVLDRFVPDVILSDVGMPGEDGYALIARVRARADAAATVPAIAVTAYAAVGDRVKLLSSGFQMHIAKPAEPAEICAAVRAVAQRG